MPTELSFRSQESGDQGGIPDIVGVDANGMLRLIIEAKFWAGLTENQPVGYLARLSAPGDTLVFVAPNARLPALWSEIQRRCTDAHQPLVLQPSVGSWQIACASNNRRVALTSWSALLAGVMAETERQKDAAASADLAQLIGLTEEIDRDTFLPVRSEELSTTVHRRVLDFARLVGPIVDTLELEGMATREGRLTHALGWTASKLQFRTAAGTDASLTFDVAAWMNWAATPFWLQLGGPHRAAIQLALAPLDQPTRRVFEEGDSLYVALFVPAGVERDQVIKALVADIRIVAGLLPAPIPNPTPVT
jgi:hypothetical protein